MKWFDNWICKRYKKIQYQNSIEPYQATESNMKSLSSPGSLNTRGMNFTIYKANGGHILEYVEYDPLTDRRSTSLHIITADQDMGQAIGHAITFESVRR